MENTKGRICKNNQVIIENVDIYLYETESDGVKSWEGHFDIDNFAPGLLEGEFQVNLDDGRSGKVIITNISTSNDSQTGIDFQGSGPLA
jgi:hypothetical protein